MIEKLKSELNFRFSRSSGPGGQSVNKVSTQVELLFNIPKSVFLTNELKEMLVVKLYNRINSEGILIIKCDETRSQLKNKEIVINRFVNLITDAFKPVKNRIKTKPGRAQKEKRLIHKKAISEKKKNRKTITDE
jgi:ribosome-associated protein